MTVDEAIAELARTGRPFQLEDVVARCGWAFSSDDVRAGLERAEQAGVLRSRWRPVDDVRPSVSKGEALDDEQLYAAYAAATGVHEVTGDELVTVPVAEFEELVARRDEVVRLAAEIEAERAAEAAAAAEAARRREREDFERYWPSYAAQCGLAEVG